MSFSSARSAIARPWSTASSSRRRATWCWPRCTPTVPTRRSTRLGMKTFDQSLYELYETGFISYEDALRNADSKNELRLRIKLESKREAKAIDDGGALRIVEEDEGRSM